MNTLEMISNLEIGFYAQCINAPLKRDSFEIEYCVEKYEDGSIHWCSGKKGSLMLAPFIMSEAKWEYIKK